MIIKNKYLKRWKSLKEWGDQKEIQRIAGVSHVTVIKAFRGEASEELFKIIQEFYNQRSKRIKSLQTK